MKTKSMLVVDDEESIRISLKGMLENENFQVETAVDAPTALKKLGNHQYDIILTDIMLDGISGVKLLKNINENYLGVIVILMTGYASIDTAIDALRSGASDYIVKPCSKKKILSSIENAIKRNNPHKNMERSQDPNDILKVLSGKKPLTKKELLVCKYLLHGLKSEEMASKLDVTLPTIKFHLRNIYLKLGIKGRREIIKIIQNN